MSDVSIRQISRDKLFQIFKSWELVKLFEDLFYAVENTLPGAADAVQAALSAHISDPGDAHQATAIGATPGGSRLTNTVQGQLGELDTSKASTAALTAGLAGKANTVHTHSTGDISGLGSMATQSAASIAVTGGSINGTPIGATTPATGKFTAVESSSYLRSGVTTVGSLPSAATSLGVRYFVLDASATTFMSVVTGGGGNVVPVFSDGTDWRIG